MGLSDAHLYEMRDVPTGSAGELKRIQRPINIKKDLYQYFLPVKALDITGHWTLEFSA